VHASQIYNYSTGSRPYWGETAAGLVMLAELIHPDIEEEGLGTK